MLLVFKKTFFSVLLSNSWCLSTLSADTSGKLDILGHDGDTLGMDRAQVGVLKKTNQVGLAGFLQSHNGRALESQVSLEILGNFPDQPLEGQFPDEQLSALLVTSDLSQSNGSRPVPVGLLYTTGCWCTLSCSLGCKLLSWGLAASWFSCCLLGTCHFAELKMMPSQASNKYYISGSLYTIC